MLEKNKRKLSRTGCIWMMAAVMLFADGCKGQEEIQTSKGRIEAYSMEESELGSNRHTMAEKQETAVMELSVADYEATLENERFILYYKEAEAAVRLLDKSSGYVWGCLENEHPEDLNKKWTEYANAVVAVEYADEEDKITTKGVSGEYLTVTRNGEEMEFLADLGSVGISFFFTLALTEDGFAFEMDDSAIQESGENRLVSVTFLPYWGSVQGDRISGYLFVPDGCGALIRFREPRRYLSGFSKRIYGVDYGVDSMSVINDLGSERINAFAADEKTVSVPVFGMSHGTEQNAYFAIVEQGEEYAQINADPAGIVTNYNRIHATFLYRSIFEQPVNKKGSGVQSVQKTRNQINPRISYHFLVGQEADYSGMAKGYRTYLKDQGLLNVMTEARNDIPMSIDFLAADIQKEFIGTSVNQITEADEIKCFLEKLSERGIGGYTITLLGWQKKGLNGCSITAKSDKSVFTEHELEEIRQQVEEAGGTLSFGFSFFSGTSQQLNAKKEGSITMSQALAEIPAQDESIYLGDRYLLKPVTAAESFRERMENFKNPVLLKDMGHLLYGEYLENAVTTRSQAKDEITEAFKDIFTKKNAAVVKPNAYLYPYVSVYRDMPVVSSQYVFETDTVPFLQIVLSGSMELYSPYLNGGLYSRIDLLKMIDYGVYPSFILTGKSNYDIKDTASSGLLSSAISDWEDYVAESYSFVNEVLKNTWGEEILDREVLATGLVRVDYPSGSVYVNYTDQRQQTEAGELLPQSAAYVAREGGAVQ